MDLVCRVCLSEDLHKKFSQIKSGASGKVSYGEEIFTSCLNIEPTHKDHQLCLKCYRKLISFYKFKLLALKNNYYFGKGLREKSFIKTEVCDVETDFTEIKSFFEEIKNENDIGVDTDDAKCDLNAVDVQENESDEELLSAIKSQKDEIDAQDDVKENKPIPKKKGRPRKHSTTPGKHKSPSICSKCGKVVSRLREHMFSHIAKCDRQKIACDYCPAQFTTYNAKKKHVKTKHLGIKQHCQICDKDVIYLNAHMAMVHNTKDLKFSCLICGRKFLCKTKLADHMRTHTNTKPYECDECGKTFRIKLSLVSHIRNLHLKIKPHLCQICSKSFFTGFQLRSHLRTHTKEKPYPCRECGKMFSTSSIRKCHEIRHTQNKNYPCPYCDMAFYNQGSLKVHIISHTKERRYQCQYCGVKFGRSDHKSRHEKTAHEKHMIK